MPKGKTQQKSGKGIPRSSRSVSSKKRRMANHERQPERKLRHILAAKRGVIPFAKVAEAKAYAQEHGTLSVLKALFQEMEVEA